MAHQPTSTPGGVANMPWNPNTNPTDDFNSKTSKIWLLFIPVVVIGLAILVYVFVFRGNNDPGPGTVLSGDENGYYAYEDDDPTEEDPYTGYEEPPEEPEPYEPAETYDPYVPAEIDEPEIPYEPATAADIVSAETFMSLNVGMSMDEVRAIMEVPPTSETESELLDSNSTMLMWAGQGLTSISVTFTNGYASWLMQIGLSGDPQPGSYGVTHDAFARIRNGMSLEEVQWIVGVVPSSITEVDMMGIISTNIMWGLADLTTITVGFTNGQVSSTTQMGIDPPVYAIGGGTGITMDAFLSITNGMTMDEVLAIIGEAPMSEMPMDMFGVTINTAMWMSGMTSITVTLTDGVVTSTMQIGL